MCHGNTGRDIVRSAGSGFGYDSDGAVGIQFGKHSSDHESSKMRGGIQCRSPAEPNGVWCGEDDAGCQWCRRIGRGYRGDGWPSSQRGHSWFRVDGDRRREHCDAGMYVIALATVTMGRTSRFVFALPLTLGLAACQSSRSNFEGPNFSNETRTLEKQLDAEAVALGTAQGAVGAAAAFDRTGVSRFAVTQAGRTARNAMMTSADARLKAQLVRDEQEAYRRYGMNPDGTPSGRKPAGVQ